MSINPALVSPEILAQYKNTPALTPPPGVVPDFSIHNERAEVYNIVCSMLLGAVYLLVCLRMYAKFWIKRNAGFDDCEAPSWLLRMIFMADIPSGLSYRDGSSALYMWYTIR